MYIIYYIICICITQYTCNALHISLHPSYPASGTTKVLSWEPYSSAFAAMSPTLLVAPAPRRQKCLAESLGRAASKAYLW